MLQKKKINYNTHNKSSSKEKKKEAVIEDLPYGFCRTQDVVKTLVEG
jgi:hypothetical protein